MYLLIVFLPLLGSSVAGFFGRFLGSEGTAIITAGRNLVLFAILIFGLIFLFRLYCFRLKKKYGFRLVFMIYISFLFFISFFCFYLRLYLISHLSLYLKDVFSFVLVFSVGTVITAETEYGKMMMASSGGSGSSNSTSWTGKASFEERVLIEPFPETDTDSGSDRKQGLCFPLIKSLPRGRLKRPCRRRQHRQKLPTPLPIKKTVRHF